MPDTIPKANGFNKKIKSEEKIFTLSYDERFKIKAFFPTTTLWG